MRKIEKATNEYRGDFGDFVFNIFNVLVVMTLGVSIVGFLSFYVYALVYQISDKIAVFVGFEPLNRFESVIGAGLFIFLIWLVLFLIWKVKNGVSK